MSHLADTEIERFTNSLRVPWYKNKALFVALLIPFTITIVITYGLIPNYYLPDLAGSLLSIGNGEALARSGLAHYPSSTGYPFGTPIVFGLPLSLIQIAISAVTGASPTQAYIFALIVFVVLIFSGCFALLRHLGVHPVTALIFCYAFLCMNFLWGHLGYQALPFAFGLIPLFILVDKLLL